MNTPATPAVPGPTRPALPVSLTVRPNSVSAHTAGSTVTLPVVDGDVVLSEANEYPKALSDYCTVQVFDGERHHVARRADGGWTVGTDVGQIIVPPVAGLRIVYRGNRDDYRRSRGW